MGIDAEETSTSTSTGAASIPIRVYDESFASMAMAVRRGMGETRPSLARMATAHTRTPSGKGSHAGPGTTYPLLSSGARMAVLGG